MMMIVNRNNFVLVVVFLIVVVGTGGSRKGVVQAFTSPPTRTSITRSTSRVLLYRPELDYDHETRGRDYRYPPEYEYNPQGPYPREGRPAYFAEGEEDYRPPYEARRASPYGRDVDRDNYYNERGPSAYPNDEEFYSGRYYEEERNNYPHEDHDWNRFYGTSMNSRREFDNFYEQRSYDMGPLGETSDRIPAGRSRRVRRTNFKKARGQTLDRRIRNRRKNVANAASMQSDRIPGRDQGYADSKEDFGGGVGPRRGPDLWSQVFDGTRSAMDNVMRRGGHRRTPFAANGGGGISVDLKSAMRDQQQTLQPLLEEALQYVQADPACHDLLGSDIRLDQPFTQSQSSGCINGRPQESRIQVQVAAEGTRDRGLLDVLANNLGIREMILEVPSQGRRINVQLGLSPAAGIDLVDRGVAPPPPPPGRDMSLVDRRPPPDVLDAEFEVMNNTVSSYNNSRW